MELIIENRKGVKFSILFDSVDLEIIKSHKWHVANSNRPYPRTTIRNGNSKRNVCLHHFIMGTVSKIGTKIEIDHINRNVLDNRRINLRMATLSQNGKNKTATGKSKFMGVCKSTGRNKWQATIKINGKYKMIGRFDTELDAAIAYDKMAKEHHGEFANLNFPAKSSNVNENKNEGKIYSKDIKFNSKYLGVLCKKSRWRIKTTAEVKEYIYWFAHIEINGQKRVFGSFKTEVEAAMAYDAEAKIHFGNKAILNFKL